MVMEYMDHDLKSLMDDKQQFSRPFSVAESKCLMLQLLAGVSFLHQVRGEWDGEGVQVEVCI